MGIFWGVVGRLIHPEQIFHPRYFNCLVYNSVGNMNATQLEDNFEFNTLLSEKLTMFPSRFKGYYLIVQNRTDFLLGEERSPILLTDSTTNMFYFTRKFYNQHPSPYSSCGVRDDLSLAVELPDRFLFDQVIQSTSTYTQKSCFLFCTQQLTNKLCGCQSNRIAYNITGAAYCPIQQELTCAIKVANYGLWPNISALFDDQCRANCPLECSHMLFDVKTSTLRSNLGYGDFSASLSDLAYVELVEEPLMDGWSLLAILGGHCHLLLGMSLASFLELGQFILIALATSLGKAKLPSSRVLSPLRTQATLLKMGYIPSVVYYDRRMNWHRFFGPACFSRLHAYAFICLSKQHVNSPRIM